jgi:hypothetical protein
MFLMLTVRCFYGVGHDIGLLDTGRFDVGLLLKGLPYHSRK